MRGPGWKGTWVKKKPLVAGLVLIAALLAVGVSLGAWKYTKVKADANKGGFEPPEFVETLTTGTIPWQPRSRLVGTVIAKQSVTLANEIVGVVTEVGFDSGDTVEAGQVLLRLDTSTEKADMAGAEAAERLAAAAVSVAEADIRVAEAELEWARSNYQRVMDATAGGSTTAGEIDRSKADLDKAKADLERQQSALVRAQADRDQARARIEQINTLIAKKTLKSPFKARAGMRMIHPGQYLAEGTSIVGLTELTDDIYLDFAVPQEYASRATPGMVVTAKSEVLGSEAAAITVVSVDATVNPTTRNVRVRASVPNPGYTLKPGMFIDVEVPTEPVADYVAVPTTSVRRAAFGDHVFVLMPGDPEKKDPPGAMRAEQRMVTLGPDVGGQVIISKGLKKGELIATSGSFKLRPGALVMQAPPPGAGGGAGPGGNGPGGNGSAANGGEKSESAKGDDRAAKTP